MEEKNDPVPQENGGAEADTKKNQVFVPTKVQRMIGKIVLLFFALLLLQIPIHLIRSLNESRAKHADNAAKAVAAAWSGPQTLSGLSCGGTAPGSYDVSAVIRPEIRRRGIYQSAVYTADLSARAEFPAASGRDVTLGLSDLGGLLDCSAEIDGKNVPVSVTGSRITLPLPTGVSGKFTCTFSLKMRGSGALLLDACGKHSDVKISGAWDAPDFAEGSTLPDDREISGDNFSAHWRINQFTAEKPATAGVRLNITAGDYQQVERTIKYATFFLVVFFFTILAGELFSKTEVCTIQYLVASGAPVLFYLMLLAVGEKTGFALAYGISAAVIVTMVTGYAAMFLHRITPALAMGAVFAAGYVVNYLILRMEEYALLSGTIVLAVILGILMLLTGKINTARE